MFEEVRELKEFFPKVLGNGKTRERLGVGILSNTLPHAFLIVGPLGSGKSTLAREISAALNCERRGDSLSPIPCGSCSCCKRISDGNFPDVKILGKQKDKATLGVEAVKDFREDMFLSSTESEHKIYIIDDGECMTQDAQNALLKVLEEPPEGVVIMILATEGDKILTTIKSRAQYIPMSRFSPEELKSQLLVLSPEARALRDSDPEGLADIIISSEGVLGEALRLCGKKNAAECIDERKEITEIVKVIINPESYKAIYSAFSTLPAKRAELLGVFEKIISAIRDLIAVKESESAPLTFFSSRAEAVSLGAEVSVKELIEIYDEIQNAHLLCARNANVTNLTASLASRIRLK